MRPFDSRRKSLFLCSLIVCLSLSLCLLTSCKQEDSVSEAYVDSPEDAQSLSLEDVEYPVSGVNEDGFSYGSDFYANSHEDAPDLIAVWATNNKPGYVYRDEMNALIYGHPDIVQKEIDKRSDQMTEDGRGIGIPVYQSDGKTLVGEYIVSIG